MRLSKSSRLALARALKGVVGQDHVLVSDEDREDYSLDSYPAAKVIEVLGGHHPRPDFIARPGSVEEVQEIVRLALAKSIPLIPYGNGTGVMGAAVPAQDGLILDLRRMDRVRWVDEAGFMVEVEAGSLLGDIDQGLHKYRMFLGHDPWSQGIATVGGAISTNGVGYLAAGYGTMGEQVLSLEVVLPNGDRIDTKRVSSVAGPWIHSMFIGAEGTLGVVTAATLRVFPEPDRRSLRAFTFPDFAMGYHAITNMGKRQLRPVMIDYSEEPLDRPGRSTLYIAFDGFTGELEARELEAEAICTDHGGSDLGDVEAKRFWDTRHEAAVSWTTRNSGGRRFGRMESWGGPSRWFDYLHLAIPPGQVLEYKSRCELVLADAGLVSREYAIWGRPDLFSVITAVSEGMDFDSAVASEASDQMIDLAHQLGGSMEYCHGVGLKLRSKLADELAGGIVALRKIKQALDPDAIMNPGKLI